MCQLRSAAARGPRCAMPEQRRIGVWFVGANANNPSLNWFQDQLLQVQSTDPRYRVDLRVLFSNTPHELPANLATEKLDGLIIQGMEPAPDLPRQTARVAACMVHDAALAVVRRRLRRAEQ